MRPLIRHNKSQEEERVHISGGTFGYKDYFCMYMYSNNRKKKSHMGNFILQLHCPPFPSFSLYVQRDREKDVM